jgi:hypothetical protein
MKRVALPLLLAIIAFTILPACRKKHSGSYTYTLYRPVFKNRNEVLKSIVSSAPQALADPGKIFIKGKYLLINERDKGIHVIDNSDPVHPKNLAFLNIPGNVDMAMRGDYIYADMFSELITLDVSDPAHLTLQSALRNAFQGNMYYDAPDTSMVMTGLLKKDTTIIVSAYYTAWPSFEKNEYAAAPQLASGDKGSGTQGIGGSSARFAIVNDYLYTAGSSSLGTWSLQHPARPDSIGRSVLGWGIETVYPFQDKLFVGANNGMYIFDITEPSVPQTKGTFFHITSCDPVIANEKYAFVTLRDGTTCGGNTINELNVLDVSNVSNPKLLKTYAMFNPRGLGKDGRNLFVCEGTQGVKVFDARDPLNLKVIGQIKGFEAYDVIVWDKLLIVTGPEGIRQYEYSETGSIKLLSKMTVPVKSRKE